MASPAVELMPNRDRRLRVPPQLHGIRRVGVPEQSKSSDNTSAYSWEFQLTTHGVLLRVGVSA